MKLASISRRFLVGVACMSFMFAMSARAGDKTAQRKGSTHQIKTASVAAQPARPRVVLVEITGSRIPQRVVANGRLVNSGAPLTVFRGDDLTRTGATTVAGILAQDPDITFGHMRR